MNSVYQSPSSGWRKREFHATIIQYFSALFDVHMHSPTLRFAHPSPLMRHSLATEGIGAATPVAAGDDSGSGSTASPSKQQGQAHSGQG